METEKPQQQTSTAKLTNTVNSIGYTAFNNNDQISRNDILSSYSKEALDKVWRIFTTYIIKNYQSGKGTYIKSFGTFTFTNVEYSLEGTTNQFSRDIKLRRPVFIITDDFCDGYRPGQYNKSGGLVYYTQKPNNSISIVKLNYAEMSYGINISKEEFVTMFNHLIKDMSDQLKNKTFKNREMPGLGVFITRANVFGMKFIQDFNKEIMKIPQKYIFAKKNIGLFMETEKTNGRPFDDLRNAEKAIKEITPGNSVITHITERGEQWLKNKMNISLKKDVIDVEERKKFSFNNVENYNKHDRFSSTTFFTMRNTKSIDGIKYNKKLKDLNLPPILLNSFIANKGQIIKEMKEFDRRNNGIITRFEFIRALSKANIHHNFTIQIISELAEIYAKNLECIDYFKTVTCMIKDIKIILKGRNNNDSDNEVDEQFNNKFKLGPKNDALYRSYSKPQNHRIIKERLSENSEYENLRPSVDEVENEIKTVKVIFKEILGKYTSYDISFLPNLDKMISFNELNDILHKFLISYNNEKIIKILKYIGIKDPNQFSLNEFNNLLNECKVSSYEMMTKDINVAYEKLIDLLKKNSNNSNNTNSLFPNLNTSNEINLEEFINIIKPKLNYSSNIITVLFCKLTSKKNKLTLQDLNEIIKNSQKTDFTRKFFDDSATRIKKYIASKKMSNNAYFNHLLNYNECRMHNKLSKQDFLLCMQQEPYNPPFTPEELSYIFDCLDTNKDSFVDRVEFKQGINKEQDAVCKMQDIIKKLEYEISDMMVRLNIQKNQMLTFLEFKARMRVMDYLFTNEFIESLFIELAGSLTNKLSTNVLIDEFNVFKGTCFKETNTDTFKKNFISTIQNSVDFHTIKKSFEDVDSKFSGKISKKLLCDVVNKYTNSFRDEDIMKFVRITNLTDFNTNEVLYTDFLNLIYYNEKLDIFLLCIDELKKLLSICKNDINLLINKINTSCNIIIDVNWISLDVLTKYFKDKLPQKYKDQVTKEKMTKFDLDSDGKVTYDDLYGIIQRYISTSFFKYENSEKGFNVNLYAKDNLTEADFKSIVREMKKAIKKKNVTEIGLFKKLDENNDGFISNYEFNKNISSIVDLAPSIKDKIFNYLDYYHNGLIDLQTFLLRFKEFKSNEIIIKNDNIAENVIIDEFVKWIDKVKSDLCDTEVFQLMDKDNDGLVSLQDLRFFVINILDIPKDIIDDFKLERVMQSLSLTKNKNISIGDIKEFISKALVKNVNSYYVDLKEIFKQTTNLNLYKNKNNQDWVNQAIEKFGMFISEKFETIEKFYNEYMDENSKKFKFENFEYFINKNYDCFYGFNLTRDELLGIFTTLDSQKKNYLTLEDFKNKLNLFDFYKKMHFDIKTFMTANFPTNIDAFRFFLTPDIDKVNSPQITEEKNYLTRKEFFNGLNYLFPKKYTTNTILEYFNRYFNNKNINNTKNQLRNSVVIRPSQSFYNNNEIPQVTFSQFSFVYFDLIVSNDKSAMNKTFNGHLAKISTTRSVQFNQGRSNSYQKNAPFRPLPHEKLETPFDSYPLEKLRKLIRSSPYDYVSIIKNKIAISGNGTCNKFEFRNLIRDFQIGLTSIEIENIIDNVGKTRDNKINLVDFLKFVTGEDKNLIKSQNNIRITLGEIKSLLYKYYSNPKLAFEFCDNKKLNTIDFEQFKAIVNEMYKREDKPMPNYALLKNTYDFIDQRKDGIVDLNEWTNSFGENSGKLDLILTNKQIGSLRKWETSHHVINLYQAIARNKKILLDKVKIYCLNKNNSLLIHENNLIEILKDTFLNIRLTNTQWKMIVEIADKTNSGLVDFDLFIKLCEHCAKKEKSHPRL